MNKVFTSTDQINKHYFPKDYRKKRLEEMPIEELSKYEISLIMKKIRRILQEE